MLFVIWIFRKTPRYGLTRCLTLVGSVITEQARGSATDNALEVIDEYPVFGAGVHTIYEMPEGPHNMFLAMMVDYGIGGLIVYLLVIIRLILIARRADRDLSGLVWLFGAWLVIFSFTSHNLLEEFDDYSIDGVRPGSRIPN